MARKDLEIGDIVAIKDSREQTPLDLSPLKCETGTLPTGDYTVRGLEHIICVERKSLQDMIGCIGHGRERFDKEMVRILAYPSRLLVVEGSLGQIALKQYRGEVEPNAVLGSLLGWMASGVPMLMVPTHAEMGTLVARFLYIAARRRWREAQSLCSSLKIAT